jgi:hypothetical protein
MTDAFTKVVELAAIEDKSAETVAKCIFERWICRYSCPMQIVTDNGKEFANQVLDKLCDFLNIKHRKTTPYHPQSNSSAESFNRSMKKYLRAMLDNEETLDWELWLPMLQLSYNCHVHKSTLESPFFLTYHHDPRLPTFDFDNPQPLYNSDYATAAFTAMSEANKRVFRTQWEARKIREEYYNRKAKERSFDIGDKVLFFVDAVPRGVNPKLWKNWQGPFLIKKKLSPLNYVIQRSVRSKERTVHIDKLRLFLDPKMKKEKLLIEQTPVSDQIDPPSENSTWGDLVGERVHSAENFAGDTEGMILDDRLSRTQQARLLHESEEAKSEPDWEFLKDIQPQPVQQVADAGMQRSTRSQVKTSGEKLLPGLQKSRI